MIHIEAAGDLPSIIVLESAHLERLRRKHGIRVPTGNLVIFWTPDINWLNDALVECDGTIDEIMARIAQSQQRPEVTDPGPYFDPIRHEWNGSDQEQGEQGQ